MKRLLPSPWLSLGIFLGWLLLVRSTSEGQIILAAIVAVAMPLLMSPLRPRPGPLRHWGVLIMLILRVGHDVLLSAIQVSVSIVRGRRRPPNGQFVEIPLELRDIHALAALTMITAVVPGTVWSELAADRSVLLLHVFDLENAADFVRQFKARYERPLKEIFE